MTSLRIPALLSAAVLFGCAFLSRVQAVAIPDSATGQSNVVSAIVLEDGFDLSAINLFVGADAFYNVGVYGAGVTVANVESGLVWTGHEALANQAGNETYVGVGSSGELSAHATAVGGIIGGLGPELSGGGYSYVSFGIAPMSTLQSGSIGYNLQENGSFELTTASLYSTYRHFFGSANVINSSWGGSAEASDDWVANMLDAFARANPTTTFVAAAGNEGPDAGTVGSPATGYNNISVGASSPAHTYTETATFSSRGPGDFYNPVTQETVQNVRAMVDILAPGADIATAYYDGTASSSTNLYSIGSGTSYAAPVVSAGVALLNSASLALEANNTANWSVNARDARVIKAVLLCSADQLAGWDNGQSRLSDVDFTLRMDLGSYTQSFDNVTVTTQSLDWAQGAGSMNLERALGTYLFNTGGWAYGNVEMDTNGIFWKVGEIAAADTLTVTLAWFADTTMNLDIDDADVAAATDEDYAISAEALANLNLEIWLLSSDGETLVAAVAASRSLYNAVEHISLLIEATGQYAIRIVHDGMVYGDYTDPETYGVAWNITAVPEPALAAFLLAIAAICAALARRRKAGARTS